MCGIFGLISASDSNQDLNKLKSIFEDLLIASETRGKEASGLFLYNGDKTSVLKSASTPSELLKNTNFKDIFFNNKNSTSSPFVAIGHSRLVTNGRASLNINNQPVIIDSLLAVHNGIITNHEQLSLEKGFKNFSELDSEVLLRVIDENYKSNILPKAIAKSFNDFEGTASCAVFDSKSGLVNLATNNGSIYFAIVEDFSTLIFASESFILKNILTKFFKLNENFKEKIIEHLDSNTMITLNVKSPIEISFKTFDQALSSETSEGFLSHNYVSSYIFDYSTKDYPDLDKIKRCTKCVLPHTFPYISFDTDGVCNYCNNYKYQGFRDHERIKKIVAEYKKDANKYKQNCIVGLSGGRDSCYGLHYLKKELDLNPVAFTYDWGLVTDLARRNIYRMCGDLGVEHILVSADIRKKRENVRKNISAWLKKPNLFMIPLFMAGDKQFYLHAHKLKKQLEIKNFLFCAGNTLEETDFKVGFADIRNNSKGGTLTQLSYIDKARLLFKYGSEFIKNPSYLNSSIFDTAEAYYSTYLLKDDYIYLYHYIPWIEDEVENTLKNQYGWEGSPDTSTSWRVGDGTAAFYNYIYFTVAGFTEHDTFRSNQIREGMITRDKAMELITQENQPRWDTLNWYSNIIGFSIDDALTKIHQIPKLF